MSRVGRTPGRRRNIGSAPVSIRQVLGVLRGEVLLCRWSEVADHLDDVFGIGLRQRLQVAHRFAEGATPGGEADDAGVHRCVLQVQGEQMAEFTDELGFVPDLPEIVDVHLGEVVGMPIPAQVRLLILGSTTTVRTMPSSTA